MIKFLKIVLLLYIIVCIALYFFQEKLIFFPEKLDTNYKFCLDGTYKEVYITTSDGKKIHALHFTADSSKGVVFYLHGNAGSLARWGDVASYYTKLQYDVYIIDYKSFGKSEGRITSQKQLYDDIQTCYNEVKKLYTEDKIIVLGYSIGTGLASSCK